MLSMNVKPATISIKLELKSFINQILPGKEIGKVDDNGIINEKRKQGMNTEISKGRFILIDHFFIKISDR
ncbi:hypothetical protein AM499_06600 [Bacillus sp. FJAT-22090]|uniref:hypothetical protein n=1 Tax=Bacillus sp. FJAT-22090 TaxID=1581038 RepID=UPI0006B04A17|nr:hypothetical protein [Bacillus sp. FJAT-22090]ALC85522.1 hypothetical protein AM499_06600 [Bacillus sp. FJAT-22090]